MKQRAGKIGAIGILGPVLLVGWATPSVHAENDKFDLGVRAIIVSAGGEPTNDQMGAGIIGRYRLSDRWLVGLAIDQLSGDFERPYELFGNTSPEEIDGTVDSTIISALIEREYGRNDRKLRWFWSAGLGFTSPDVDDVTGSLTGGGTFDITTDAGSETLLVAAGGLRRNFSRRFGFEISLRADRHFADWRLTDRSNGTTATIDDYTAWGLNAGLRVSF